MVKFTIKIIGSVKAPTSQSMNEKILFEREEDQYECIDLDAMIVDVVENARTTAGGCSISLLQSWNPEVSISLFVDRGPIRGALHHNCETIKEMADAGASFDFDPYIYQQ